MMCVVITAESWARLPCHCAEAGEARVDNGGHGTAQAIVNWQVMLATEIQRQGFAGCGMGVAFPAFHGEHGDSIINPRINSSDVAPHR